MKGFEVLKVCIRVMVIAAAVLSTSLFIASTASGIMAWSSYVFFAEGDDKLSTYAATSLRQVAKDSRALLFPPERVLVIEAHSDPAESDKTLSDRRGRVVKGFLTELGVPADRMVIKAFSDTRPLVKPTTGAPEPQNRRVALYPASRSQP